MAVDLFVFKKKSVCDKQVSQRLRCDGNANYWPSQSSVENFCVYIFEDESSNAICTVIIDGFVYASLYFEFTFAFLRFKFRVWKNWEITVETMDEKW